MLRVGIFGDYMAPQHLWTARREAWLCRKREDQLLNEENLDRRHRSHAITAVLSAVAFLEAFVNAVWQDAAEGQTSIYTEGIPDHALATMADLWKRKKKGRYLTLVRKFQDALERAGHEPMDETAEPFESLDVLVGLRNSLVHSKPQWHWADEYPEFVDRLKSKITRQLENRQPIAQNPWFPNKALGAGCADWACKTSIDFARTWHDQMGLTGDFDELYLTSLPPVEIDD